jgi:hypothetical protein
MDANKLLITDSKIKSTIAKVHLALSASKGVKLTENGSWSIVTSEAGLAHAGTTIDISGDHSMWLFMAKPMNVSSIIT